MVASRDERGGINRAGFEVVIRRIGAERLEFVRLVGRAVIRRPRPAAGELGKAEHVHDAHGRQRRAEQFRPLSHARADEQAAVAAARDGELAGLGVMIRDQPLRRGDEIVEHVLFFQYRAGLVPLLAVFAAAAQVRLRIDAAHFHPDQCVHGKARRQANVESAVSIKQRRVPAVEFQPFLVREEHRHARAVLAAIEHLRRFVVGRIEIDFRLAEHSARPGAKIVMVDRARNGEAGEGIKRLRIQPFAAESAGAADAGQLEAARRRPLAIKYFHFGVRVFQIRRDELIVDRVGALQPVAAFGNDLAPVAAGRLADVDRDDASARGVEIRAEIKNRPDVVDERVVRVKLVEQFDHGRVRRREVFVIDAVAPVRPLIDGDDQVTAIVGDAAEKAPFLLVRALIDQLILRLRRAEPVIIELLKIVQALELMGGIRFVEAAVEKSLPILCTGRARGLHPLDQVRQIRARFDLAHLPFLPIGTGGGKAVGDEPAVIADRIGSQGHGAVGGE